MMLLMRHHGVVMVGVVLVALTRRRRGAVVDVASRRRATARATTARRGESLFACVCVCVTRNIAMRRDVPCRVTRRGAARGANAARYHIALHYIIYCIACRPVP